ncbi:hypothetical protein EV175_002433 [Coemansia sp. RSA 1933]|nr:hypothetical protein EV175_002433 [Coemansia sp. RSA 1933]
MATDTDKKPVKRKTAAEIRQAQREKQQQERTGFDQTRDNAHHYLQKWATDRNNWKFSSAKQRWIVQHLYMDSHIPADIFTIAIDYLAQSKGDTLRASMIGDAELIADPMLANNSDNATKARRERALGMLPSHVTKAEAKASKRAKAQEKVAADPAKKDDDEGTTMNEDTDDQEDPSTEPVSESACERAKRVIKALREPPKTDYQSITKRKRDSDDDETESTNEEPKKKAKKDSDKKQRKREKKMKRMEEKKAKKAEKKAKKAEKAEKESKKEKEKKAAKALKKLEK